MIRKKLKVYKKAKSLITEVYRVSATLPSMEKFNLSSQMCRSSISIISNLAEGLVKSSVKNKLRFIEIAYASLSELDTQIEICLDLGYLHPEKYNDLSSQCIEIAKMLSGLRRSIQNRR